MRPFIISALVAPLIGCTWVAPQGAEQSLLMGYEAANTGTASAVKTEKPRHRRKTSTQAESAKFNTVANVSSCIEVDKKSNNAINTKSTTTRADAPPSSQSDNASDTSANAKSNVAVKTELPQSSQPDDRFDPVIKRAMPTIAAKMENSSSIELVEMKRSEKNASGKSIDTICGYVRGKSASGAETGDRPFLYLVQENQVYIGGYDMATSPYHNLCRQ
jgi:hypothetical protein